MKSLYSPGYGTDAAYAAANLLIATLYALNMCDAQDPEKLSEPRAVLPVRSLAGGGIDTAYRSTSDALVYTFTGLMDGDREGAEYAREIISDWFGDSRAAHECVRIAKAHMVDTRLDRMTPAERNADHAVESEDGWTCDTCGHTVENYRHI